MGDGGFRPGGGFFGGEIADAPPDPVDADRDLRPPRIDDGLILPGGIQTVRVIDVKAYGAVGDGRADDTRAIQRALDGAPDGYVVYFPPGTYRLSPEGADDARIHAYSALRITRRSCLTLLGDGDCSILRLDRPLNASGDFRILDCTSCDRLVISTLAFDFQTAARGGLHFEGCSRVSILRNTVLDSGFSWNDRWVFPLDRYAFIFAGHEMQTDLVLLDNQIDGRQICLRNVARVRVVGNTIRNAWMSAIDFGSREIGGTVRELDILDNVILDPFLDAIRGVDSAMNDGIVSDAPLNNSHMQVIRILRNRIIKQVRTVAFEGHLLTGADDAELGTGPWGCGIVIANNGSTYPDGPTFEDVGGRYEDITISSNYLEILDGDRDHLIDCPSRGAGICVSLTGVSWEVDTENPHADIGARPPGVTRLQITDNTITGFGNSYGIYAVAPHEFLIQRNIIRDCNYGSCVAFGHTGIHGHLVVAASQRAYDYGGVSVTRPTSRLGSWSRDDLEDRVALQLDFPTPITLVGDLAF
jgi:pectate lyase-like protein